MYIEMDRDSAEISAYIPCYNGGRYLEFAIRALLGQTFRPNEIIVIDDGSVDQTREIARGFPVRLISHTSNRGLAAARNTAIQNAKHEFIASIDADVVPEPTWLESLTQSILEYDAAGAGGRLIEKFTSSPADRWRATHMQQDLGSARAVITFSYQQRLAGFGTIFRKSALARVGGYDERYRSSYEDIDICRKLIGKGYTLIYEPRAIAYHIRRDSVYSVLRSQWGWDFWPEFYLGNYKNILRKLFKNYKWTRELIFQHMQSGDASLIAIDCAYLLYFCYWDMRYVLCNKSSH